MENFALIIATSFVSHFCVALSFHHWEKGENARDIARVFITSMSMTVLHGLPLIVFSMLLALGVFSEATVLVALSLTYAVFTRRLFPSDADNTMKEVKGARDVLMVGLEEWHGEISIVRDVGKEEDEENDGEEGNGRLIFGYSPHAFIPHSAAWLHLHPAFERLFPNRQVCTLTRRR